MKILLRIFVTIILFYSSAILPCHQAKSPELEAVTVPVNHGEGPHYDPTHNALYFVDIADHHVNRLDLKTGKVAQLTLNGPIGFVILTNKPDTLVAARGREIVEVVWPSPYNNATESDLAEPPKVLTIVDEERPDNRLNDAKADEVGRLWAGTMGPEPVVGEVVPNQGALYRYNPLNNDLSLEIANTTVSNGLIWSKDNKVFYFIDSPTRKVVAYDFNFEDGTLDKDSFRVVFDFDENNLEGVPDGMTIDDDDNLWIACFNGYKVIQVDPNQKKLLFEVDLEIQRPTSVMWGGEDLDILFITTSRFGLTAEEIEKQPTAGSVLALTGTGIKGRLASKVVLP